MATVTVFTDGFNFGSIANAWDYGDVVSGNSTTYSLADTPGAYGIDLAGQNFSYDGNRLIAGIINTIYFYEYDGSLRWKISNLTLSAAEFRNAAANDSYTQYNDLLTVFKGVKLTFNGGSDDDVIYGGDQADTIRGGLGSDTLIGRNGNDFIDGGGVSSGRPEDYDTLDYSAESSGGAISVDLTRGRAVDSYGATDTVKGIEIFIGGDANDTFVASSANVAQGFAGGGGLDTYTGGDGKYDAVYFDLGSYDGSDLTIDLDAYSETSGFARTSSGNETLTKIDIIRATYGYDTISGSAAGETFSGMSGQDEIDGSGGGDTVDYSYEKGDRGASVNLTKNYGLDTYGYRDTLTNIENVIGTAKNDAITGDAAANNLAGGAGRDSLRGLAGADVLDGGSGNDRLEGGANNDKLTGGEGGDSFVFGSPLGTGNIDSISDYDVAADSFVLMKAVFSALSGSLILTDDQFVKNKSGLAADASDRIIYETDTGKLFYDSNGSAAGGSVQFATIGTNLALTSDDFQII